jgi:serine/threonine protein phosphatase 1
VTALFRKIVREAPSDGTPSVPPGHRIYAVGDIHGRADLLDQLLGQIDADDRSRARAKTIIVFLGDLIDRGPASAEVIERLRTYRRPRTRTVPLCGNHEEVLLRLLHGDSALLGDWLRFGGAECLASYGVDADSLKEAEPVEAVSRIRDAIPKEHQRYLEAMGDTFAAGDYLFVHAGVRPGVQLAEQSQTDLRWIRQPFLEFDGVHGFVVVHGHTISEQVELRSNRIGIDTGAYRTGILTAMGLERDQRWFVQTCGADAGGVQSLPSLH